MANEDEHVRQGGRRQMEMRWWMGKAGGGESARRDEATCAWTPGPHAHTSAQTQNLRRRFLLLFFIVVCICIYSVCVYI